MACEQCGSKAVMQSGVCLNCGYRNPPAVDKAKLAEEQRRQEEEAARQQREAARAKIEESFDQVSALVSDGQLREAWTVLRAIQPEDGDHIITKRRLEAGLWGREGLPEKQLEILESLQSELPFAEDSLDYYYELACLFQVQDSPGKALHLFKYFIDAQCHTFRDDILARYRELKASGVPGDAGAMLGTGHRVYIGGMQPTVESLRAWIDQASRVPEYFRHSILLNETEYNQAERVEQVFSGELAITDLVAALKQALTRAGLDAFHVEQQQLTLQFGGPQGHEKAASVIMLRPRGNTVFNNRSGSIHLGVEAVLIGRTGASLNYYAFFTPQRPEDTPGQQPDIRDFNDAIYRTVMDIYTTPDPQREALLGTLRDLVRGTVEAELERRGQAGCQSFF